MGRWVLVSLLLLVGNAGAQFIPPYIADYRIQIDLHADSTLMVTETIAVNFGQVLRHGIYRKIPYRYTRKVRGIPLRYNLRMRLQSVTDANGQALPVKVWREGDYLVWRIGDPHRTVTGWQTYRLTYAVARAINTFPDHDELYWNATGNEWEWDIARALCIVMLPEGVDAREVRFTFYTGRLGSQAQNGRAWVQDRQVVFSAGPFRQGEGLTVVVGIPKGVLRPPSLLRQTVWWLTDNWVFLLAALLPLLTLGGMGWNYWRYGRDPIWREALVPQYRPPDNLTPAEVGVLLDERADNIDIVATVIDLAVKGYLKIREVPTTKFLFLRGTDYEFVFLQDDDGLKDHEQIVLDGLRLGTGRAAQVIRLSELRERFYPYLRNAKAALYRSLTRDGYFANNPETVRSGYLALGIVVEALGVFIAFWAGSMLAEVGWVGALALAISAMLSGGFIMLFAPAMPRKTSKGARALWHILGFREFIRRVERDRLERMLEEDPMLFDRVLPYALVFGIADEWAAKFEGLLQKPPDWFESERWTPTTFTPRLFIYSLGDSMSTMNSVFPSTPARSSGSGAGGGFSGFGGGGGFSGGGFGGGGGGGW
ncbi:MAG: hypothetical protein SLRJCFUN_002257 [Candidatus Fervidibacter sp.]